MEKYIAKNLLSKSLRPVNEKIRGTSMTEILPKYSAPRILVGILSLLWCVCAKIVGR